MRPEFGVVMRELRPNSGIVIGGEPTGRLGYLVKVLNASACVGTDALHGDAGPTTRRQEDAQDDRPYGRVQGTGSGQAGVPRRLAESAPGVGRHLQPDLVL